jgi:hypothetical protein
MNLSTMQQKLPWTVPYSGNFDFTKPYRPHADIEHTLIHIVKSAGILAGLIDQADHAANDYEYQKIWQSLDVGKRTADFVICAIRIANVAPNGPFDLEQAVIKCMESVNSVQF